MTWHPERRPDLTHYSPLPPKQSNEELLADLGLTEAPTGVRRTGPRPEVARPTNRTGRGGYGEGRQPQSSP